MTASNSETVTIMSATKPMQDGSGYHQPMRILHRGEHRLFPPSDNLDAPF
jgi:hypothetical protein